MNLGTRRSHPEGPAIVTSQHRHSRSFATTLLALLALAALACVPAEAQFGLGRPRHETNANRRARIAREIEETYSHAWEIGGGGGYMRYRSGEYLQRNNEINFWADATRYFTPKFGITGEIRGAYGKAKVANTIFNIPNPQISEYPYMAGVTYRFYRREKFAGSVFALGGAAIGKFDFGSKGIPAYQVGLWNDANARPAFSVGVNIDMNVFSNFVFRIAPNYTGTTFSFTNSATGGTSSGVQNNLGFNMGLLYRFGKQK